MWKRGTLTSPRRRAYRLRQLVKRTRRWSAAERPQRMAPAVPYRESLLRFASIIIGGMRKKTGERRQAYVRRRLTALAEKRAAVESTAKE